MDTHPPPFKSTLAPLPQYLGGEAPNSQAPPAQSPFDDIVASLPVDGRWIPASLRNYQGFWIPDLLTPSIIAMQQNFTAHPTDILVATPIKCGTTWLKALTFATVTRQLYPLSHHPLLTMNPHECFHYLEGIFLNGQPSQFDALSPPRLIATHLPYSILPESMNSSGCRIVYLCRDPKDSLVSLWHFWNAQVRACNLGFPELELDEAYQLYCEGISAFGPFWDHNLGYWKESMDRPDRVLFLKYEEMMEKPAGNLVRLAEFLGCQFSDEEKKEGVVDEIVRLCSFEKMSGLEVNRTGCGMMPGAPVSFSTFFRKGKVGDWVNHLSLEMGRKMDEIVEEKLLGSGLVLPGVRAGSTPAEGSH